MSGIETAPAAAGAKSFGLGRALKVIFGTVGILAGLAFLAGAGVGIWALGTQRDGSGYFTMTTHRLQTPSYALSSESLDVNTSWVYWALADRLGRIRITATSTAPGKPFFIGIARAGDVNGYLGRVEHDELGELKVDPFSVDYRRLGGHAPAALPAAQRFWRARAAGTGTQTITWPVEKGRWSAVIMNADGSRPVGVDTQLAARVSGAWWIVAGLLALGVLSLIGGGALLYFGARTPAPQMKGVDDV